MTVYIPSEIRLPSGRSILTGEYPVAAKSDEDGAYWIAVKRLRDHGHRGEIVRYEGIMKVKEGEYRILQESKAA